MERSELESEIDALFERTDARIHALFSRMCSSLVIIENDSTSYNSNRGTTNEEAITCNDPDH